MDQGHFSSVSHTTNWFFPCGFIPLIFASCHSSVTNTLYLWQLTSNCITSVIMYLFIEVLLVQLFPFLGNFTLFGAKSGCSTACNILRILFWFQTDLWVIMILGLLCFFLSASCDVLWRTYYFGCYPFISNIGPVGFACDIFDLSTKTFLCQTGESDGKISSINKPVWCYFDLTDSTFYKQSVSLV